PWLAIEAGWIIAEYGRQPWAIEGVLPTFYAASGLTVLDLSLSLGFFVTLYTILAVVMVILMVRAIKAGPKDYVALLGGEADPLASPTGSKPGTAAGNNRAASAE